MSSDSGGASESPEYPQYAAQPYPAQPNGQPIGANGLAIGSFVFSCVGLVTCGLGSIVGVVMGIIALRQIQRTGQSGRGLAIAGLVIGGVLLLIYVVYFVWTAAFAVATGS